MLIDITITMPASQSETVQSATDFPWLHLSLTSTFPTFPRHSLWILTFAVFPGKWSVVIPLWLPRISFNVGTKTSLVTACGQWSADCSKSLFFLFCLYVSLKLPRCTTVTFLCRHKDLRTAKVTEKPQAAWNSCKCRPTVFRLALRSDVENSNTRRSSPRHNASCSETHRTLTNFSVLVTRLAQSSHMVPTVKSFSSLEWLTNSLL